VSLYLAWLVLILEHLLLLAKLGLAHCVPDTPRWVEREQAKRRYTQATGGFRVARSAKEEQARRATAGSLLARMGAAPSSAPDVPSGWRARSTGPETLVVAAEGEGAGERNGLRV